MCGLAGFLRVQRWPDDPQRVVLAMADALVHRGPDEGGTWVDVPAGVAFGHRRLAVVDLSPMARQPMQSSDGRYVLAFNGEIYNHRELRAELERTGQAFRGHSDTEALLEGIARWGVIPTLRRAVGMFAFALWDSRSQLLTLARDRFGEKPLYYGEMGGCFVFASELKALRPLPGYEPRLDLHALRDYLRFAYVPTPMCIFRGMSKLPPGHAITVSRPDGRSIAIRTESYWRAADFLPAPSPPSAGPPGFGQASRDIEALLADTVRHQMIADVPLGAFLSGGIDSTVIVALMQSESRTPVRTFSIGSPDAAYDESRHAAAVASHLGTDHTELVVGAQDALAVVPSLADTFDEPFADSSQIPTMLLSRLTRRFVTVALSGDGGDEIFGGYNRYVWAPRIWSRLRAVPLPLRSIMARTIHAVAPRGWDAAVRPLDPILPMRFRFGLPGEKLHKLADVMLAPDLRGIYERLTACWYAPPLAGSSAAGPEAPWFGSAPGGTSPESEVQEMIYRDTVTYLPDDILAKVDRASMSASLECRVPYLDHRILERMSTYPLEFRIASGVTKRILRDILDRHVPRALVDRPKSGFGVPIDAWLKGPLREWSEALLDRKRLAQQGLLDPEIIGEAWKEHLSGRRLRHHQIWTVLMLQTWLERTGARA